jgi:hypothetical protein
MRRTRREAEPVALSTLDLTWGWLMKLSSSRFDCVSFPQQKGYAVGDGNVPPGEPGNFFKHGIRGNLRAIALHGSRGNAPLPGEREGDTLTRRNPRYCARHEMRMHCTAGGLHVSSRGSYE